mmetsp:Transcript_25727/g.50344  ORF Transcript_25727/g.50344 Transcript_25727/m.50344 type:complete len:99 (+) Transcript_25727:238-534(+)
MFSQVIQKLIPFEEAEADESAQPTKDIAQAAIPVLLFARAEKDSYIFCGKLKYLGHDPSMAPLRFVWGLEDFEQLNAEDGFKKLVHESERLVKELYQR